MEIYSYGNVDALQSIFWTIKLIMGGSDYLDIIRTFIVVGFMVAAISGLSGMRVDKSWGWLVTLFVTFSILFIPKTDVIITDKLGSQPPVVVQNVPWSIGILKTLTSTAGHTLTTLAETASQTIPNPKLNIPAELSYQRNGLMFGNRLVKDTLTADIQDPQLKTDLINFIRNCTVYDLMDGTIPPRTFTAATNVWPLMSTTNPARFTSVKPTSAPPSTVSCTTAYSDLNTRLVPEIPQVMKILGAKLYPTLTPAAAVAQLDNAVLAGYQKTGIANVAATSADLIRQNIMINTFAETGQILGLQTNDPGAVMLAAASAQTTASLNASYTTQGRITEQALPLMRNVVEVLVIAGFPIFCIMAVVLSGRALANLIIFYVLGLVWIELWPFLFSILNSIATLESAKNIAAHGVSGLGTDGVSLETASGIYSTSLSDAAVVGSYLMAIPAIAAAMVYSGFKIAGAIPGINQMFGNAADREASQAAKGNYNYGNVSFEQQTLSPTRTSPFLVSNKSIQGTDQVDIRTGEARYEYNTGTNPLTITDGRQIGESFGRESADLRSSASAKLLQASSTTQAAYSEALALSKSASSGAVLANGTSVDRLGSDGLTASDKESVAKTLATRLGISDTSVARESLEERFGPSTFAGSLQQAGARGTVEDITNAISTARDTLRAKSVDNQLQVIDQFRTGGRFESLVSGNREATDRFDATYSRSRSLVDSASAELRQSEQYREFAQKAEAFTRGFNLNYNREFNDFLRQQGKLGVTGSELKGELAKFISSGELVGDSSGRTSWVSRFSDGGASPTRLGPDSYFDPGALDNRFRDDSGTLRSASQVETDRLSNASKVRGLQKSSGLTPGSQPSGDALRSQVSQGQSNVSDRVAPIQSEVNTAQANRDLADRAKSVSVFQVKGATGRNEAVDALENETGVKVENLDRKLQRSQEWKKDAWPNKKK